MRDTVFVVEIRFEHFGVVGVDRDLYAVVEQLLERMLFNGGHRVSEIVAPRVDFERNAVLFEHVHGAHIFDGMDAMTDPMRLEVPDRLDDIRSGRIFAGMDGNFQPGVFGFQDGFDEILQGVEFFAIRQVYGDDVVTVTDRPIHRADT